jgi:hypothetical protein
MIVLVYISHDKNSFIIRGSEKDIRVNRLNLIEALTPRDYERKIRIIASFYLINIGINKCGGHFSSPFYV